ncbi:MAG: restriction endonuclease subunit S [Lewinellaceae bacterium]|nr:restriction endonuclease subunit S [Lewinellaceae bacterium]
MLPNGWTGCKLDDLIIKIANGCNAKQSKDVSEWPITRIETISNETIDLNRVKYISEISAKEVEKYGLRFNDILLSHINSDHHLGKTAIFKLNKTVIHGINLLLIRFHQDLNADFFNYQFKYLRKKGKFIEVAQHAVNQSSVNQKKLKNFDLLLPPLPEQHRIVNKIEELFSELDNGIANLEKARAQLKVYRQAVLKSAFEGKLTEQWRAGQMGATEGSPVPNDHEAGTGTLPSAEDLLTRIQEERQNHYEQQLTEWQEAVAEWEANASSAEAGRRRGKDGRPPSPPGSGGRRKPSKPKKPKEYPPLTEKELGELPELPVGWNWVKLYNLADVVSGVTKGGRKLDGKETMMLPYLRVANVQDGFLDLSEVKEIEALPSDFQKYKLEYGDILYTEGGDKDKLGRGTIWKNEIPDCIHQNHIYRARLYSKDISNAFVGYFSQTQTAKKYFYGKAKQTVNLASINLTVLSNLPLPIPSEEEQGLIVQEIESRLSVCDHMEQEIETALQKSEALRQSILKKAFEGRLVPQDPAEESAEVLLERIKAEKVK